MENLKKVEKGDAVDFEQLGFETMLETGDGELAREICALRLHGYERSLEPEFSDLRSEIAQLKNRARALYSRLYDRPAPVNDAAMLVFSLSARIVLALAILAAVASLAGNLTLFSFFGFGLIATLALAAGATALPLVVGHLAYEKIVVRHKLLQSFVIVAALGLCFGGLLELGQARRTVIDRAAATRTTTSYVDGTLPGNPADEPRGTQEGSESSARQTLGGAIFIMLVAADVMLGFLAGLGGRMRTDEDYAAWQELKKIEERARALDKRVVELLSSIGIAKADCMAGILRAQTMHTRRHPPYHRALVMLLLSLLFAARPSRAQKVERYEGILIDTSGSIARGGTSNELFRDYLLSTKKLLLTEPANSRVWVSVISTDSFGGAEEILKGWTPEVHGVFTDDLMRARRQLAASFAGKSSGMAPVAARVRTLSAACGI